MKPTRAVRKYQITYLPTYPDIPWGRKEPVVQEKYLITDEDYENIVLPLREIISTLEKNNKGGKPTKESSKIRTVLKELFGEQWFTDKSPLFGAIGTGKLELLPHQGGTHRVQFKKIKE